MLSKRSKKRSAVLAVLVVAIMLLPMMTPLAFAADPPVLMETTVVASGAVVPPGPVYAGSTFKLHFSNNVCTSTYWATVNQPAVTLHLGADGTGAAVPADIVRLGDGTNTDLDRNDIYVEPQGALTPTQVYSIRIDPTLTANNGMHLGQGNGEQPVIVSFTVSAGLGVTVTNHLTIDAFLTLSVDDTDLYYHVVDLGDAPVDSTTVHITSNDNWMRTLNWTSLTGANHGGTIPASDFGGISDQMGGSLVPAGPNEHSGGPTLTYAENLIFTYLGSASNPRADEYTGTITIEVAAAP